MRPNETADIRKALDRLQQSFEMLSDRYRDLRRERKQLRERIEEMGREREIVEANAAAQIELAGGDRRRVAELEERAQRAERLNQDLLLRVDELESTVAERESLVAEQEELLAKVRAEADDRRHQEEESWTNEEQLRKELGTLRQQIAQMQAEAETQQQRMGSLVAMEEGHVSVPSAELDTMREELDGLRSVIAKLREDRASMEGKHLQAIGKLDAATRAEAMARTEVARLEGDKEALEEALAALRDGHARYEERMRELESERGESLNSAAELDTMREELIRVRDTHARATQELEVMTRQLQEARQQLDAREEELRSIHATAREGDTKHAVALAVAEERLSAVELERERLEGTVAELKREGESARVAIETLRDQLKQAESSDDDRLRAQREKMDEMAADLSEALDMAARKEIEVVEVAQELERLRARVAELSDELERLRTMAPAEENGVAQPPVDDEERARITEQIDSAIRLIDRHLAAGE